MAIDRLLQNQVDIGNAIKPFYGDAEGDQLTALLKTHITDAADVVNAAKDGDSAKLSAAAQIPAAAPFYFARDYSQYFRVNSRSFCSAVGY
jgi:hypothetical protein